MSRQQLLKVITILDLDCKTTKEMELFKIPDDER